MLTTAIVRAVGHVRADAVVHVQVTVAAHAKMAVLSHVKEDASLDALADVKPAVMEGVWQHVAKIAQQLVRVHVVEAVMRSVLITVVIAVLQLVGEL